MTTATQVRSTTFTIDDLEVVGSTTIDAARELVWAAHTEPEHVRQWLLGPEGWTMPVCEIDLRPGGEWHWVWRREGRDDLEMRGVYKEVLPPARLVNTENWGGPYPETLNTLTLTEENGHTTIRSAVRYPTNEARDAALETGMLDGWAESNERLERYLESLQ